MAPKVFLTGATGYIGGTAHAYLAKAHPDWEFTLLVRNEERAKPIKAAYPKTQFAYGTLDDSAVIEKAASEADIVVHTADSSDHFPGATAIAKGLAAGHSAEKPGYWIHVSGTSILTWYDKSNTRYGEAPLPEQKYHDIDDIERIINFPDFAHHRDVDKLVQEAISDSVKVAILCPPCIYGEGAGTGSTRSRQVPDLARATLEKGFAPIVGVGETKWDHIHIDDVGTAILKLADATQDPSKRDNPEIFGLHAYYFAENGSHKWADVARWIAEEASKQGYLPEPVTKSITLKELQQIEGVSVLSWGENSAGVAQRAKKYLGWEPNGLAMEDEIAGFVTLEAKALGLTPKDTKG